MGRRQWGGGGAWRANPQTWKGRERIHEGAASAEVIASRETLQGDNQRRPDEAAGGRQYSPGGWETEARKGGEGEGEGRKGAGEESRHRRGERGKGQGGKDLLVAEGAVVADGLVAAAATCVGLHLLPQEKQEQLACRRELPRCWSSLADGLQMLHTHLVGEVGTLPVPSPFPGLEFVGRFACGQCRTGHWEVRPSTSSPGCEPLLLPGPPQGGA